jgi:hypothetical protein
MNPQGPRLFQASRAPFTIVLAGTQRQPLPRPCQTFPARYLPGLWRRRPTPTGHSVLHGKNRCANTLKVLIADIESCASFSGFNAQQGDSPMGKYLLAWLLGVPTFVLFLFWVFF